MTMTTTASAATELGAAADARWAELDAGCRVPADLYESALAAGLFRALVPADMGGTGASPVEWFRTGIELARHDPSFGWVVTQGAAELGWIAAGGDPGWAAEVLADPYGASASTVAGLGTLTVGTSSTTLHGSWRFNTGVQGATWIGGLSIVAGQAKPDGSPELRIAWVPADRAEIVEDWDAGGLRGTGSHSTVIREQEIDEAWTFSPFDQTPHDRGAHRALVGNGNWPIAVSVAATQLGAARRAIDEVVRIAGEKASPPDFVPLARQGAAQRAILRAEGLWRSARAGVEHELEALWDEAALHGEVGRRRRVRLLAANVTASEHAAAIVSSLCEIAGTVAVDRTHPLARVRRDVQALQAHVAVNGGTVEAAAKVELGLLDADVRV